MGFVEGHRLFRVGAADVGGQGAGATAKSVVQERTSCRYRGSGVKGPQGDVGEAETVASAPARGGEGRCRLGVQLTVGGGWPAPAPRCQVRVVPWSADSLPLPSSIAEVEHDAAWARS